MKSWIYAFIIMLIIIIVIGLDVGIHYWVGNNDLPSWMKLMLVR